MSAFQAGIVWVNCSQPCFCHAPWGARRAARLSRRETKKPCVRRLLLTKSTALGPGAALRGGQAVRLREGAGVVRAGELPERQAGTHAGSLSFSWPACAASAPAGDSEHPRSTLDLLPQVTRWVAGEQFGWYPSFAKPKM